MSLQLIKGLEIARFYHISCWLSINGVFK